jgi:hypothetical protein
MKMIKNLIAVAIIATSLSFIASCKPVFEHLRKPEESAADTLNFISRNGTQLMYKGEPFRFTGYNANYFFGCGAPGSLIQGAAVDTFFRQYCGNGNVVRIWAIPGINLTTMDAVIAAAKAHGVFITADLSDALGQCGDKEGKKDSAWYAGGYKTIYLPWVKQVVARYKDEPAIAYWEFLNEPSGKTDYMTIRSFMDSVGAVIKGIDANHLICSGTMPAYAYSTNPRDSTEWKYINACPYVDITSIHEYDTMAARSPHLNFVLPATIALDKPIVIGEYGFNSDPDGTGCLTSFATRAIKVKGKLDDYFSVPQVCGAMLWSFMWGYSTRCTLSTYPADTSLYKIIPHYPL